MKKLFVILITVLFIFSENKMNAQNDTIKSNIYELRNDKIIKKEIVKFITTTTSESVLNEYVFVPAEIPIDTAIKIMNKEAPYQYDFNKKIIWRKWWEFYKSTIYNYDEYLWKEGGWVLKSDVKDKPIGELFVFFIPISILIGFSFLFSFFSHEKKNELKFFMLILIMSFFCMLLPAMLFVVSPVNITFSEKFYYLLPFFLFSIFSCYISRIIGNILKRRSPA